MGKYQTNGGKYLGFWVFSTALHFKKWKGGWIQHYEFVFYATLKTCIHYCYIIWTYLEKYIKIYLIFLIKYI